MKLYEIDAEIMRLADEIPFDDETGEIPGDVDEFYERIEALQMEKLSILQYLAKLVLNLRADESALKAEEQRLKSRRERIEKKEARLLSVIDRECGGERTDLGIATADYRISHPLDVTDPAATIQWLTDNGHMECIKFTPPEVRKTETKALITKGNKIPGAAIADKQNFSLK